VVAKLLDGRRIAARILEELTEEIVDFIQNNGVTPTLAAVLVGDDPASQVYVRHKRKDCEKVGIASQLHHLPATVSEEELLRLIARLNRDDEVHGILVQLPLPAGIDAYRVLQAVAPAKDVDGFHPENAGLLVQGRPRFIPCTPAAVCELLDRYELPVAGRHVVILGRSEIVGKPLANLLLRKSRQGDATVTVCHSRTHDLPSLTRSADFVVAAIGRAGFLTADMVRPGVIVVDVGINRTENGLVGDVDFESVGEVASWISPVPGGVGPLTRAMLLRNTILAARAATR
jgi:methylenetetrahydrofolate dehydrogenase (NADP+)/methenyltetrahydrofolate cyclohydrolase